MKTAVEWLEEMFNNSEIPNSSMLFKQAKEMEKQQVIDFAFYFRHEEVTKKEIEQYYNETFKSE